MCAPGIVQPDADGMILFRREFRNCFDSYKTRSDLAAIAAYARKRWRASRVPHIYGYWCGVMLLAERLERRL